MDLSMTNGEKTKSHVLSVPKAVNSNSGHNGRSATRSSVFEPVAFEGSDAAIIVPKIRYNHGAKVLEEKHKLSQSSSTLKQAKNPEEVSVNQC